MNITTTRQLLTHTNRLHQRTLPSFVSIEQEYNVFELLGVHESEQKHSALIADLLDPNGRHGLGIKFLSCFLAHLGLELAVLGEWLVKTEENHRQGRWDIALHGLINGNRTLVLIENKINAAEGYKQLMRYRHDAEEESGYLPEHIWLVFLTPEGRLPVSYRTELNGAKLCVWSYHQHVRRWLDDCLPATTAKPRLHHVLRQYLDLLATYHNQHVSQSISVKLAQHLIDNQLLAEAYAIQDALIQTRIELQLLFWEELHEQLQRQKVPLADNLDYMFSRQHVTDCYRKKRGNHGYGIATVLLEEKRDQKQLLLWIELDKTLRFTVYIHKKEDIQSTANVNRSKFGRVEMQKFTESLSWSDEPLGNALCWKPVESVDFQFLPFELESMQHLIVVAERQKLIKKLVLEIKRLHVKFHAN